MFGFSKGKQQLEDGSEVMRAFGKIQAGLEAYWAGQLAQRGWTNDRNAIKDTMSFLISGLSPDEQYADKSQILLDMLKASPDILTPFCEAMRVKLALLMQSGAAGEGFKIVKNLKQAGVQAVYIDQSAIKPEAFIIMANDFGLACNVAGDAQIRIDETKADRLWNGAHTMQPEPSIGELRTLASTTPAQLDDSIGEMNTLRSPKEPYDSIGEMNTMRSPRAPLASTASENDQTSTSYIQGRYQILNKLGEGGFGTVYRARDHRLKRDVALKKFINQGEGKSLREYHLREAHAIAHLSHPSIVQIFDVVEEAGILFIVMELITGESLRAHLSNKMPLPLSKACSIGMNICEAMIYAHRKDVIHRDLKPENILLVDETSNLKLVDFGLAKNMGDLSFTRTGSTMGTLLYMAPEQLENAKSTGKEADVFSFGKIFYELLTGRLPATIDLSQLPVNQELRILVQECTRARPEDRPHSFEHVLETINQIDAKIQEK
jgi:tRNA A-37 threonylcarbamoyl transferase component Bud32